MGNSMNSNEQTARIRKYEKMMNEAILMLDDYSPKHRRKIDNRIRKLELYLSSSEWMADYKADEEGRLPKRLKRGVLSEDGIYNLLERYHDIVDGDE